MERRNCTSTSSGIAHVYINPQPLNTKSYKDAPLPPLLQKRGPEPRYHAVTSYMKHHSEPGVARGPNDGIYSKAPPHWSTHLMNSLAQKLQDTRSLRLGPVPLHSEMQDQYRGRSAPCDPLEPHYRPLKDRQLYESLVRLPEEPAISTCQADYRRFSRYELAPFTQSVTNLCHLPAHQAPPKASSELHLHRPAVPVPHGSRSSVYMDSFREPAPPPMFFTPCMAIPAGTESTEENGSLLQHILDVPEMYGTESQTYGRGVTVLL